MASPATEIDASGRTVRVSNPDRVIFRPTETTPAVSKLQVVQYYLAVGPGILRALHNRPTTLERWPKGVHDGVGCATRTDPHGDAFYQKRVPQGRSGVRRDRARSRSPRAGRPTRCAPPRWRWSPGRRRWARSRSTRGRCAATTSTTPTSCASTSTRSRAPAFADAVRVAGAARELLDELGMVGFPKTSGQPGRAHLRPDRAAVDVHRRAPCRDRVRTRAGAPYARR